VHGGARRGGRPPRIHHLSSPQAAGALPPPSSTRVACGRHPSSQASVPGQRRPPARHPLGGQAGGALMCRSSTASPLRLCASTQTRDALRVKHGLPTLHRQPPQLGCRRHPSTTTTTSARLPAAPLYIDNHLSSAAGEAARHPSSSTATSARLPVERRHRRPPSHHRRHHRGWRCTSSTDSTMTLPWRRRGTARRD
jgi:hypothetical protein